MTTKTFDPKCYDLAEDFLDDESFINTEHHRRNLAGTIQQAIEDWLDDQRGNAEPPDPPGRV